MNQWRQENEDQIKSESNANVKFIRLNRPKISSIKKNSNSGKSIKKNNVVYNYIKKDSELKLKLVFGEEISRSNIDTSKIKLSGANGSLIIDSVSNTECNITIKGGTNNGKISVSIEEGFLKDELGNKSAKCTAIEKVNIIQDNQAPNAVASYDEENNLTITLKASNIKLVEGTLDYDSDVIEYIGIEGKNNWQVGQNSLQISMVSDEDTNTEEKDIAVLNFKIVNAENIIDEDIYIDEEEEDNQNPDLVNSGNEEQGEGNDIALGEEENKEIVLDKSISGKEYDGKDATLIGGILPYTGSIIPYITVAAIILLAIVSVVVYRKMKG